MTITNHACFLSRELLGSLPHLGHSLSTSIFFWLQRDYVVFCRGQEQCEDVGGERRSGGGFPFTLKVRSHPNQGLAEVPRSPRRFFSPCLRECSVLK